MCGGKQFGHVYDRYRALIDSDEGRPYWISFAYNALYIKHFGFIPINKGKTIGQLFCEAPETRGYEKEQLRQKFIDGGFGDAWDVKLKNLDWQLKGALQVLLAAFDRRKTVAVSVTDDLDISLKALKFLVTSPYFAKEGAGAVWFVHGPKKEIEKQLNSFLGNVPYVFWACDSQNSAPVLVKDGRPKVEPAKKVAHAAVEVQALHSTYTEDYIEVKLLKGRVNLNDVFVDEETGYRYVSSTYLLVYGSAADEDGDISETETACKDVDLQLCDTFRFGIEPEDIDEDPPFPEPAQF